MKTQKSLKCDGSCRTKQISVVEMFDYTGGNFSDLVFGSRSRLLSHDSPNRKRGVLKLAPIDNGWYGKKASRVTLTTWKVERHWVLRTKAVNGYVLVLVASYT